MSDPPFDGPGRALAYLATVEVDRSHRVREARPVVAQGGIETVADLISTSPPLHRPEHQRPDRRPPRDTEVTVLAEVISVSKRRPRRNLVMVDAVFTDGTGRLKATWFNQAFRERQLQPGAEVALSGKIEWFRGSPQMKSPAVDLLGGKESLVTGRIVPIHPSVQEVSAGPLRRAIFEALAVARPVSDPVPEVILAELGLMERDAALGGIHFPGTLDEVKASRRRLASTSCSGSRWRWRRSSATGARPAGESSTMPGALWQRTSSTTSHFG